MGSDAQLASVGHGVLVCDQVHQRLRFPTPWLTDTQTPGDPLSVISAAELIKRRTTRSNT